MYIILQYLGACLFIFITFSFVIIPMLPNAWQYRTKMSVYYMLLLIYGFITTILALATPRQLSNYKYPWPRWPSPAGCMAFATGLTTWRGSGSCRAATCWSPTTSPASTSWAWACCGRTSAPSLPRSRLCSPAGSAWPPGSAAASSSPGAASPPRPRCAAWPPAWPGGTTPCECGFSPRAPASPAPTWATSRRAPSIWLCRRRCRWCPSCSQTTLPSTRSGRAGSSRAKWRPRCWSRCPPPA
uniref:Vesicle transport protein n=1 Tax=Macrostomum lignano TaxID=282301 RepID=A0A1I8GPQ2_9PLAT